MPWLGLYKRKSKQTELLVYFKTNLNIIKIKLYVYMSPTPLS